MAKIKNKFNGKEFKITSPLSMTEKASLVTSIADAVFSCGIYTPYMFNEAYILNCIAYYTDIKLPMGKNKNGEEIVDIDKTYNLINDSRIMSVLSDHIDDDIYTSAVELIEFRKAEHLKQSKADDLTDALTGLINKLDLAVENGFKDIDVSEVLEAAKTLGNKDEDKLAQGVLNFQEAKVKSKSE